MRTATAASSASYDGLVAGVSYLRHKKTIVKDSSGNLVYNLLGDDATKAFQKFKSTYSVNDGLFYAAGLMNPPATAPSPFGEMPCFMLGGYGRTTRNPRTMLKYAFFRCRNTPPIRVFIALLPQ